jgi:hypothetical protein
MNRLTVVRWTVATAVFLAIGWAMQRYGLNAARLALLALLILVYVYGGHGRPSAAGAGRPSTSGEPAAGRPTGDSTDLEPS